ncbi:hypothetical protein DFH27DRAFT_541184 [Peziza echinospora]|nr:hypothetical protein DFH27DRAFT_541184 [Peziza echinospora]
MMQRLSVWAAPPFACVGTWGRLGHRTAFRLELERSGAGTSSVVVRGILLARQCQCQVLYRIVSRPIICDLFSPRFNSAAAAEHRQSRDIREARPPGKPEHVEPAPQAWQAAAARACLKRTGARIHARICASHFLSIHTQRALLISRAWAGRSMPPPVCFCA